MYGELYQFLLHHRRLSVPGIGTFLLERSPAKIDFPNKSVIPPAYQITLSQTNFSNTGNFFSWLADSLNISETEAKQSFDDFAKNMKEKIVAGNEINWNAVGTLVSSADGGVKLIPAKSGYIVEQPVAAEKVIRQYAEHIILVGEKERTSIEMEEWFNKPEEKKEYWWAYAFAVGIILLMFIGWYFSENGLDISSLGNQQKSVPNMIEVTYDDQH